MMKKDSTYNSCLQWIEDKINKSGSLSVSDLMWKAGNSDINLSYVSYIINYDDKFFIDANNNVGMIRGSKDLSSEARPFSYGALKC